MDGDDERRAAFWNYPPRKQGPDIAYHNDAGSNPVLRGLPLAIATTIISSSTWVQSLLWKLNKFDKLKELPHLDDYEARHDPTVAPIAKSPGNGNVPLGELPPPRPRPNGNRRFGYYACADYHSLFKSGKLTPLDVANAVLPLIRRDVSPAGLHSIAFLDSKVDLVRQAAEASSARYASGTPLSTLDGVPIAVKDEAEVQGYKRTVGSMMDFTNPADETAWCVKMLEEAGAVLVGKTSMHEMGLDTTNNNPNHGTPLNPHNESYYTGGSSGGSAYAVSAGLIPIAIGADGGGSIRLPSSFCGIYGLKPSHGRISGRPTHTLGSVGVYGPIAASIDDLALAYRIMAQPDALDRKSAMFPSPLVKVDLSVEDRSVVKKKYIGLYEPWISRSDPAVVSLFETAIAHYTSAFGYEIVQIALPYLPQNQKAHALTILSEVRSAVTPAQIAQLTYSNQLLLNVAGSHATCQDFLAAQKLRDQLMAHLAWLWEKYPGMLIVTPTTPCAGWKVGIPSDIVKGGRGVSDGDMSLKSMEYVFVANWTGCPAISCPMGFAKGDVPVGLMAMGEWGSEEQLLAWGREGEGLFEGGGIRRPKRKDGWVDVLERSSSA